MRVRAPGVPAAGPGGSAATAGPGSCREDAVTGALPPTSVSSGTDGVDAVGAALAPGGVSSATPIVGSVWAGGPEASRSMAGLPFARHSERARSAGLVDGWCLARGPGGWRGGRAGLAILSAAEPERQPAGSRGTVSAMVRPLLASLVAAAALLLSAGAAGAHTDAAGSEIATALVATPIVLPAVDLRAA